jgi:hypothetical protein
MVLQSVVKALAGIGVALPAGRNSLQAKLSAALRAVNRGNAQDAVGSLGAFVNQVHALIKNGTLTAGQGGSLVDMATAVTDELGE